MPITKNICAKKEQINTRICKFYLGEPFFQNSNQSHKKKYDFFNRNTTDYTFIFQKTNVPYHQPDLFNSYSSNMNA